MIKSFLPAGVATAVLAAAWVGCATSGADHATGTGGKSGTSTTQSSSGGAGATGTGGSAGTGGMGTGGSAAYAILCNPVTNAGCKSGAICDYSIDDQGQVVGFRCYIAQTTAPLCGSCDTVSCGGGLACFYLDASQSTTGCARYCCDDGDCGSGVCQYTDGTTTLLFGPAAPNLGVCVAGATVDAGADAGAAALFSCDAPATSPSNGSCVKLSP